MVVSIGAHALLAALALGLHATAPRPRRTAPAANVTSVEVDIPPPDTAPRPTAPAEPRTVGSTVPTETALARAPAAARVAGRAAPVAPVAAPEPTAPQGGPEVPPVAPPTAVPPEGPPTAEPPSVAAPHIDAMALLRDASTEVERWVDSGELRLAPTVAERPRRDLVPREHGTAGERARAASDGYIRGMLAGTHHHEPPGVREYYWFLRRRMEEQWTPGITREPTMLDALVSGVVMPASAMRDVLTSAFGQFQTPGPAGSAADALDAQHGPLDRPIVPYQGIVDASHGNVRVTRAEVEVDQDADGHVRGVRIVRSSQTRSFDDAAVAAVRAALPLQNTVAMPGGRRSRWSFQVAASRDPILPAVGIEFDESTGWFEVHYPGRLHLRSRVWLEASSPLGS